MVPLLFRPQFWSAAIIAFSLLLNILLGVLLYYGTDGPHKKHSGEIGSQKIQGQSSARAEYPTPKKTDVGGSRPIDINTQIAEVIATTEGDRRIELLAQIAGIWAQENPQAAARWFQDQPETTQDESIAGSILSVWMRNDPVAAGQWIQELKDASLRCSLYESLASGWADQFPDAATQWMADHADHADSGASFHMAFQIWIGKNPVASLHFLSTLKDDELLLEANRIYGSTLAGSDSQGAWNFASTIPLPRTRRETLLAVTDVLADIEPSATAVRIEREHDPKVRIQLAATLAKRWIYTDPAAVERWIATSSINIGQKEVAREVSDELEITAPATSLRWGKIADDLPLK